MIAVTRLVSPGAGCATTDALTTPYALIKFPAQDGTSAQFFKQDRDERLRSQPVCGPCTCPVGSDCDPATGKWLPARFGAGGSRGRLSRVGQVRGRSERQLRSGPRGRGFRGICACPQNVACDANSKFNGSPSVCACVPVKPPVCRPVCEIHCPNGVVRDANGCQTCKCNPPPRIRAPTVMCAPGTYCDAGKCVSNGPSCGGIAGIRAGAQKSVRIRATAAIRPRVGPIAGGSARARPERGELPGDSKFDGSPSVCACVPIKPPVCGPVCNIACQYGNVLDANGCPTCACNPPPTDSARR